MAFQSAKLNKQCGFFPNCKFSAIECRCIHPPCKFHNTASGCSNGFQCKFTHAKQLDLENLEDETIGSYNFHEKLGSGAYSNVWRASNTQSQEVVAIKICTGHVSLLTKNEVDVFIALQSTPCDNNFVRMIETFPHPTDQEGLCIVMEFAKYVEIDASSCTVFNYSMNLFDFFDQNNSRSTLKIIDSIIVQLANSLMKLNKAGYIHADLKLENILVTEYNCTTDEIKIKICDFGNSLDISDTRYTMCQSQFYRAYEVLVRHPKSITKAIDMWSLGCIIWEIIDNNPLFEYDDSEEREHILKIMHIQQTDYVETHLQKGFEKYLPLIKGSLNIDPTKRWTAEQVLQSI